MSAAVELVRRFVDAYNAAAAGDLGRLGSVATPEAVAGYLVESHSGVVAPLASRTGVPDGASLEVDPARASEPFPGLVVVPSRATGSRARTSSARPSCTWWTARWPGSCSAPRSGRRPPAG